ncbi:MAG TPA: hypothetical protein VGE76_15260 [Opitutaceae bacterium]
MSLLDRLERTFGRFAIHNLALYIVIGQVAVVLATMLQVLDPARLEFWPNSLRLGEWWRPFTFMFVVPLPLPANPLQNLLGYVFLVFGWSLFYMMGRALEEFWGSFRFNAFLFTSYLLTIAVSFLMPRHEVSNVYILGSVFMAFAVLNPNFELTLYGILPVKVKWLALLSLILGGYRFVVGGLPTRLQIGAAVVAFLLFFARHFLTEAKYRQRQVSRRVERAAEAEQPRHVCHTCGKTDKTHPQLDFRYCSQCAGDQCYCPDHIKNHAHVVAPADGKKE